MTNFNRHPDGWRCNWCGTVVPDTDAAVHEHTRNHWQTASAK